MTYKERVQRFKQRLLARALRITFGNVTDAAKLLGLNRTQFYVTARRFGVKCGGVVPRGRPRKQHTPPGPSALQRKQYFGVDVSA